MGSPFDLIRLDTLKSWLDIAGTDDDILLARLITQISRAILSIIDRPALLPNSYTEVHDGRHDLSIMLRQWPVIDVTSCTINGLSIPPSPPLVADVTPQMGYVLDLADIAPPGTMQRLSLRLFHFTCGLQNVTISYNAGYQVKDESAIIPTTSPYAISPQSPYGDWASDVGTTYENGVPLTVVTTTPVLGQYSITNGVYTFAEEDAGNTVLLTYGYVPADLASCCMDWVAERYTYRSRIGQHSKSLGGQESMAFIVKNIPDYVASALNPYRRLVTP